MNKNLPNVYAVPIDKKIENNKTFFRSGEDFIEKEIVSLEELNKIFHSKTHVYKTRLSIKTKNGLKEVDVVGQTKDALLTLTGEKIDIKDILEIKKV